ncbi:MAG: hypothetical protein K2N69_04090, partial [Helicobacter sp.]|nr:hypothetical protein [Helicobacter sp.]
YVNSPQRMRQRYAYGSNIAAVRCGWEDRIMNNGKSKIAESKAGAALWLRHSFARAFSGRFHATSYPSLPNIQRRLIAAHSNECSQ